MMDKEGNGTCTYQEFRDSFQTLSYGLNDNDINMMIALADEDEDELITWEEFIPIGIMAIKNIYTRNVIKRRADISHPDPEALKRVYWQEILCIFRYLSYRFHENDKEMGKQGRSGSVSLDVFKEIIRGTKYLTPKEKNLLIRL